MSGATRVSRMSVDLGKVPFYWRMLDSFEVDRLGIPDVLPFEFSFQPELQLVIQRRNPEALDWLDRVYREDANVGYLQEGHALSVPYGDEFLRFLEPLLARSAPAIRSAMEIGCGGVYLLKKLKARGLEVCGVDPSPVSSRHAQLAGIDLVGDFYPTPRLTRKADLLFHHNVLEHVQDPVEFLRAHHTNLNPGGLVAVAVPDCTKHIECGDVSMMLHEHLAYFDADSLARTLAAAGFQVLEINHSRYGGVLYGAGQSSPSSPAAPRAIPEDDKFVRFRDKAEQAIRRFRKWVSGRIGTPQGLGFYVPLRAIPYLAACGISRGFRFFEDDPGIRGKFFTGFNVPVENFDDLKARPVDHLVICSHAFGGKIADKIERNFGERIGIAQLHDLISCNAGP